jgi:glyoxylase-like metal-dependent hydrolase (beta-lactamase superfamily II)
MKELLPGIHTWSVFSHDKGLDFNGHLVANSDGCVLIDPPAPTSDAMVRMEQFGPPKAIIITNRHHTREAGIFAAHWKIPIMVHEEDALDIPPTVRLGGVYKDGDRLAGGLQVVTLSGQKSPGESALLCARSNALFLGDALLGKPAGKLSMLPPDKYADPAAARAGLKRLLEFRYEAVLVGDGSSFVTGGRQAIEACLAEADRARA